MDVEKIRKDDILLLHLKRGDEGSCIRNKHFRIIYLIISTSFTQKLQFVIRIA